jgi:hypothetical protein
MKRFKQKTLCYAVLAVLLMSSLSACGSLTMEGISPMQGGPTLDDPGIALPTTAEEFLAANKRGMVRLATTGEFVGVVGCARTRREPTTYTECPPLQWDPSGAQVAASIAIGAVWYYFAARETPYDDMQVMTDRILVAIAGGRS